MSQLTLQLLAVSPEPSEREQEEDPLPPLLHLPSDEPFVSQRQLKSLGGKIGTIGLEPANPPPPLLFALVPKLLSFAKKIFSEFGYLPNPKPENF